MASERGCILMPFYRAASRPASPPLSLLLPPLLSVGSIKTLVEEIPFHSQQKGICGWLYWEPSGAGAGFSVVCRDLGYFLSPALPCPSLHIQKGGHWFSKALLHTA